MLYQDAMYGQVQFPSFIEELANTPEVQRLKLISQDVLPQRCIPYKVPSRFEHSMGVAYLAQLAIAQNQLSKKDALLLSVSALLHDTGNPPFSHLSEPFLKKLTGKDGESFLEERLDGSQAWSFLCQAGLDLHDVVRCVTGHLKPLSVLINGSMDVDNLDNVGRYWFTARNGEVLFDAQAIASSFRYDEAKPLFPGQWHLLQSCLKEAKKWQKARQAVYEIIYGEPNLGARIMVYRAVEIAFHRGELTEDFFHLNDVQAMDFLLTCNKDSAHLAQRFLNLQIYPDFITFKTTRPSPRLKVIAEDRDIRKTLAEAICKECGLPQSAACVYIGQGRDKRKIDLPFVGRNDSRYLDNGNHPPIYRVKVYVDPEFENKKRAIRSLVKKMTG